MITVRRRILGLLDPRRAALLLLPLFLVASLLGGGWYCADGAQCRPAAAAACCCEGQAPLVEDDCCVAESHPETVTITGAACGCYYHSQSADAQLKAGDTLPDGAYLLPLGHPVRIGAPIRERGRRLPPPATVSPPRYLRSPTDGRAPPIA